MKKRLADFFTAILVGLFLGGCREDVEVLVLGYNTYNSSPVMVTGLEINGITYRSRPLFVSGRADSEAPRLTSPELRFPENQISDPVIVRAHWSEVLTNRAYTARAEAPITQFTVTNGAIQVGLVFGPNGLMLITSDPIPEHADAVHLNDVARICGQRRLEADRNWLSEKEHYGGLNVAFEAIYPAIISTECPFLED